MCKKFINPQLKKNCEVNYLITYFINVFTCIYIFINLKRREKHSGEMVRQFVGFRIVTWRCKNLRKNFTSCRSCSDKNCDIWESRATRAADTGRHFAMRNVNVDRFNGVVSKRTIADLSLSLSLVMLKLDGTTSIVSTYISCNPVKASLFTLLLGGTSPSLSLFLYKYTVPTSQIVTGFANVSHNRIFNFERGR